MREKSGQSGKLPQVAILFSQFAAYHVDRFEAAASHHSHRHKPETALTREMLDWETTAKLRESPSTAIEQF